MAEGEKKKRRGLSQGEARATLGMITDSPGLSLALSPYFLFFQRARWAGESIVFPPTLLSPERSIPRAETRGKN